MKTRYTFVSNSSSSSFFVWGLSMDSDDERVKKSVEYIKNNKQTCLSHITNCDSGTYYVGTSPFTIGPDETGAQFKNKIVSEFHKMGFTDMTVNDLCEIEESWYDG